MQCVHPSLPRAWRSRTSTPRVSAVAVVVLASLLSSGCLYLRSPDALFGGLLRMRVANSAQLNKDMPVAVEVLVVYDQKILEQVENLSAHQWFEGRSQFVRDNPPSADTFESRRWEWVPAQSVPDQEIRYALGARATVVFVSYSAPGDHRAKIPPREDFLLELQANDFRVLGLD